uniref:(California timema) hypothetical protein n=1 Tax=Timema californicum TaxID=61474 RepID=A0A7R9JBZ1_TIMCA|nr:unnamed protein product [Timema californicum]
MVGLTEESKPWLEPFVKPEVQESKEKQYELESGRLQTVYKSTTKENKTQKIFPQLAEQIFIQIHGDFFSKEDNILKMATEAVMVKTNEIPREVLASVFVASFHIVVGISMAYSAILVPQLETDELRIDKGSSPWLECPKRWQRWHCKTVLCEVRYSSIFTTVWLMTVSLKISPTPSVLARVHTNIGRGLGVTDVGEDFEYICLTSVGVNPLSSSSSLISAHGILACRPLMTALKGLTSCSGLVLNFLLSPETSSKALSVSVFDGPPSWTWSSMASSSVPSTSISPSKTEAISPSLRVPCGVARYPSSVGT